MKKFSKKLIALLMVLTLMVGTWSGSVAADDEPLVTITVEADNEEVEPGDTVTYTVSIEGATEYGLIMEVFGLYYDPDMLSLGDTEEERDDNISVGTALVYDSKNKLGNVMSIVNPTVLGSDGNYIPGRINVVVAMTGSNTLIDGELFSATFTVLEGASGTLGLTYYDGYEVQFASDDFDNSDYNFVYGTTAQVTVPLTGIALSQNKADMITGDTLDLSVTCTPSNTTDDTTVTWSSSDETVATVDKNGTVTAVGISGTATITATVGDFSDTCEVTVTNPLQTLEIQTATGSTGVKKGNTLQLTAVWTPENTSEDTSNITWTSSDPTVATVDANGLVTALKDGKTTITVTVGSLTASIEITVSEIKVQTVTVSGDTDILKNETTQLTASWAPTDTTDDTSVITWESNAPGIATVDANGLVTGVSEGTATITATVAGVKGTIDVNVTEIPLTGVSLDKETLTIHMDDEAGSLTASYLPANTTDDTTATWTSSNESVAIVSASGLNATVTAVSVGQTTITVTIGTFSASCVVTVDAPLKSIEADNSEITLVKNQTTVLGYNLVPDYTTSDKSVTFSSGNTAVATVDESGTVKAIAEGETTITITSVADPSITATVKVTVTEIPIDEVTVSADSLKLDVNETKKLTATVGPEDTTDDDLTVTWTSSDTSVVTVSEDGVVTAVAPGTATVTAISNEDNQISGSCEVTVLNHITGFSGNVESVSIIKGKNSDLSVTSVPASSDDTWTVTWTSSDESVATVDTNGHVTGVAEGNATITAKITVTTAASSLTASKTVEYTVEYTVEVEEIHITSISLNKSATTIHAGKEEALTVSYTPSDTTDDTTVTWTSNNESVAVVSSTGVVTAIKPGTADITAAIGTHTATCTVTVDAPIESIAVTNGTEVSLLKNTTHEISYSVYPTNTTSNKGVTYSSSDASVATVDENGVVTAKSAGTTTITLTSVADNSITATVIVTVTEVNINEVTVSESALTLDVDDTYKLTAEVGPSYTTDDDKSVTWATSDENIVSIEATEGGIVVTAVNPGTATVTATSANGITASCEIQVLAHIEGFGELTDETIVRNGAFNYEVTPDTECDDTYTVTWSSSDESVATVDENGTVTGLKAGEAEITATITVTREATSLVESTQATYTLSATVTVTEKSLDQLTAEALKSFLYITEGSYEVGDTVNLYTLLTSAYGDITTLADQNGITDDITIVWSVDNAEVATLDEYGNLTFIAEGEVVITATITSTNGAGEQTAQITVSGTLTATEPETEEPTTEEPTTEEPTTEEPTTEEPTTEEPTTEEPTTTGSGDDSGSDDDTGISEEIDSALDEALDEVASGEDNTVGDTADLNDLIDLDGILEDITDDVEVTWSGDNDEVAVVNEDGTITFVGDGEVNVTVTIVTTDSDGNVTGSYTKTVTLTVGDGASSDDSSTTTAVSTDTDATGGKVSNTSDTNAVVLYLILAAGAACVILISLKKNYRTE